MIQIVWEATEKILLQIAKNRKLHLQIFIFSGQNNPQSQEIHTRTCKLQLKQKSKCISFRMPRGSKVVFFLKLMHKVEWNTSKG